MPKSHGRLSEQEREQRRAQDRERLKQAAEQLLGSAGWQRWVRARARNGLARYSVSNLCLILLANPEASFVAGFKAWLELGYCVRKGERAIRILAPMPVKPKQPADAESDDRARLLFRVVPVFDRSQVDPLDGRDQAPLEPPSQPLTGDSHARLLTPAAKLARELGYTVTFETVPTGVGGWCDYQANAIVIDASAAPNAQLRTLIHEITHALGVDYQTYSRERAEVIVDSVTFIVCSGFGLAVDGDSVPYVAGWGEDGALDAVTQFAQLIDQHARRIETALTSNERPTIASNGSSSAAASPAAVSTIS
jgi:hypothetical protein